MLIIINAKLYCQVCNCIFRILRRHFIIWYNWCFSINIYSVSAEQIVMSRSEHTSSAAQLGQRTSSAATQSTSFVSQLRQSTSTSQLPQSTTSASKLPQSMSLDSQLPQITSFASKLPQSQSLNSKLPARFIKLPVSQLPAPTSTVRQLPGPTPLSKLPQPSLSVAQSESYELLKLERYMKRYLPSSTLSQSTPLMSELLQSQSPKTQLRFIKSMSSVTNQSQSSQQSQPLKVSQQSHMPQQQAPSIPVSNQLQVMAQPTTTPVTAQITTIPAITIAKSTAITTTASTTSDTNPEDYINPLFKY
ncbi:hyphal wall protein 2-like [Temnothorax curvispinosus]|uniref:Hyphal wall protein 2-like n=1 Tax=Temnothorax curvispinosus TaxID=300111 RepID=A0A6J1Q581_9HYME|nr:hyphal wall protein 2-like [Temnothorax curvispinosus]